MASLKERLSKWRKINQTRVKETGDSINQINEFNNVSDSLYQGDIELTEGQLEQVKQDMEQFVKNPRIKRQAYRDRAYPKTIWSNGVTYYFDGAVTDGKPGPKPTIATKRPVSLPPGFRCADKNTCAMLGPDICSALKEDVQINMCPKMCGIC
ncbi:hypothetical protein ANCDUO_25861 [Ancylostoma duodenale]|uniref:ShTK domain protein n=1 Tax=Ancylostoma duodenale TaxID=51022 RepID=A0A0C2FBE0_9BILA|nr:hypothetical protein ANCDUO_25861 [Ancylostoma duodenale]